MRALLHRLAAGERIAERVVVVLAHPDDETLSFGSRLPLLENPVLVWLTDGAPRDLVDARREGFSRREDYAAARRAEIGAALEVFGVPRTCCRHYDTVDQESVEHAGALAQRLARELEDAAVVVTHPYEHGHPDHDTAALVVALACQLRARQGSAVPERLEFASYHLAPSGARIGEFWPDDGHPAIEVPLGGAALELKRRAVHCHATQRAISGGFPLTPEWLRSAPDYDFTTPAPPGAGLYDRFGWQMTTSRWREIARRAL